MSSSHELLSPADATAAPEFPGGPTDAEIVAALRKNGGFVLPAAQSLHVDSHVLRQRIDAIPQLDEARCQAARNLIEDVTEQMVLKACQGERRAVIFYLRTLGTSRGYPPLRRPRRALR